MKTRTAQRILLIVGLTAVLASPAFAAFGDNVAPANALNSDSAAGSALPPGTYPSSPADSSRGGDSGKKATRDSEKRPPTPTPAKGNQPSPDKHKRAHGKQRSGQ